MEVAPFAACGPVEVLETKFAMDAYADPDRMWDRIKNKQHWKQNVREVEGLTREEWEREAGKEGEERAAVLLLEEPYDTPLHPSGTYQRVVCLSDTHSLHSHLPKLPAGHILLHAGDFTNVGKKGDCDNFAEYIAAIDIPEKVVIAGNHDVAYDADVYLGPGRQGPGPLYHRFHRNAPLLDPAALKDQLRQVCTYLEDDLATTRAGLRIAGSPWQPWFCDWGFNLARGEECLAKWRAVPAAVDILLTHGPPLGHGDRCRGGNRAGCGNLLEEVEGRIAPKLHVFGHIHEGYGVTTNGTTVFVNASNCNVRYDRHRLNPPIVLDVLVG